jgi:hypothetical protein
MAPFCHTSVLRYAEDRSVHFDAQMPSQAMQAPFQLIVQPNVVETNSVASWGSRFRKIILWALGTNWRGI